jgi:hypothetical protein
VACPQLRTGIACRNERAGRSSRPQGSGFRGSVASPYEVRAGVEAEELIETQRRDFPWDVGGLVPSSQSREKLCGPEATAKQRCVL